MIDHPSEEKQLEYSQRSSIRSKRYFSIKMVWSFCLLPMACFSEQQWVPLDFEEMVNSFSCERSKKEISFETRVPIHVECSYPIFSGQGVFVEYVNKQLKTEAENRFACLIQGEIFEEEIEEEIWEDAYMLTYELFPVYQAQNLISVYGCDFQNRGCHGCSYYEGKTFWQRENSIVELVLDDLFIKASGYREFLLQYCENYFKASGYGYYSSRSELAPELNPNDLDTFVLIDKGLVIVFRAYTVGGWADGPDIVLIPYAKIKELIDPCGPLKVILE